MNSNGRHLRGAVIVGALAATLSLAPAAAAQSPAKAPSAAGATTLVFDKNPNNPTNSRLNVYQGTKLLAAYRAGSGNGKEIKNDCAIGKGWMPNGTWKIRNKYRTYNGQRIKGFAVYLEDMKCSSGKAKRTQMFIHSEMNRDGTQGRTEPRRWDGAGDYKSNGCVKLKPEDIVKMFRLLDRYSWPTHLRVVN
ncbi:L,D-transpeptidase [Streptomyces sp. NPDC047024]|uniref:L,D-transpeptidase n=1 Tax=Streptomyces sp. NPDC047024 TaxID=3155476 RepID=UPI0033FD9B1B